MHTLVSKQNMIFQLSGIASSMKHFFFMKDFGTLARCFYLNTRF